MAARPAPALGPAPQVAALPPPRPDHSALGPKPDPFVPGVAPVVAQPSPTEVRPSGTPEPPETPVAPAIAAVPSPAPEPQPEPEPEVKSEPAPPPAIAVAPPEPTPAVEPEPSPALVAAVPPDPAPAPPSTQPPPVQAEAPVIVLGGVGSGRPSGAVPPPDTGPDSGEQRSIGAQLAALRDLRARNLLTEEEYRERRQSVLRRAFGGLARDDTQTPDN